MKICAGINFHLFRFDYDGFTIANNFYKTAYYYLQNYFGGFVFVIDDDDSIDVFISCELHEM